MRILYRKKTASFFPIKYGYIYNHYAMTDARNIAPAGWHVATETECNALIAAVGGSTVAGGKLKEAGLVYWAAPNNGADNTYGFNMRGGGRKTGSVSSLLTTSGTFWCVRFWSGVFARAYEFGSSVASSNDPAVGRTEGYSARLMKDDSTDPGVMVGNDGKRYRTVKIGSQVWTADNLAETKYRNGNSITVNTGDWGALLTEARCAYNNDESKV